MSYLIRHVLAKPRLILDEMCRLHGKFTSYLRCVLCKTRLIFPRINGPNVKLSPLFFVLVSTCLALHHIKQGLHVKNIHSVKKGVGRQHTTFTSCQNAACSNNFFPFLRRVDYALGKNVLTDQMWFLLLISNWEVRSYWFSSVIVSGRHDLPSDARAFFLWPLLKRKVLHCG